MLPPVAPLFPGGAPDLVARSDMHERLLHEPAELAELPRATMRRRTQDDVLVDSGGIALFVQAQSVVRGSRPSDGSSPGRLVMLVHSYPCRASRLIAQVDRQQDDGGDRRVIEVDESGQNLDGSVRKRRAVMLGRKKYSPLRAVANLGRPV